MRTIIIYNINDKNCGGLAALCHENFEGSGGATIRVGDDPDPEENSACPDKVKDGGLFACDLVGKYVGFYHEKVLNQLHLTEMLVFDTVFVPYTSSTSGYTATTSGPAAVTLKTTPRRAYFTVDADFVRM